LQPACRDEALAGGHPQLVAFFIRIQSRNVAYRHF
jgi:hypothetical protein